MTTVTINSTLVETVSLNCEDFNETFLTCSTCLCTYDATEHTPKLLPCSHTVCLGCLLQIAATHARAFGAFRCPICRELVSIPPGGIGAFPPSFLVNQLLDLMARQRRHVVPNCTIHNNQELMFCETCDLVFCSSCVPASSRMTSCAGNCEHIIVPFSVAIKRMSEILLYKANECLSKLKKAETSVAKELEMLHTATGECLLRLDESFAELSESLEKRKSELTNAVKSARESKQKLLEEQITLIGGEKEKVEEICAGLQYQVEVRTISHRISNLSAKLTSVTSLEEPRENSFLHCNIKEDARLAELRAIVSTLGKVVTTTTLPSLSSLFVQDTYTVNLEAVVTVKTVDYHGNARVTGGDPITATITEDNERANQIPTQIIDLEDGTYAIKFRPRSPIRHRMEVTVLGRTVKNGASYFDVTEHNNPICVYGKRGSLKGEFVQPVAIAINEKSNLMYVLDTGNSRIQVLKLNFQFVKFIENSGMLGRSCTGLSLFVDPDNHLECWLAVVNWRTKKVTRMEPNGRTINSFTHECFVEPISLTVDDNERIVVADNAASTVFLFSCAGDLINKIGSAGDEIGRFCCLSAVCFGPRNELIVADTTIQVFNQDGLPKKEHYPEGRGKGRYSGIAMDDEGMLVLSRVDKSRNYLQVVDATSGTVLNAIDSHNDKLRRPSGIAILPDKMVIVADLGDHKLKKFRYW